MATRQASRTASAKTERAKAGRKTAQSEQLQVMIRDLMEATKRGDEAQRKALADALGEFNKRPVSAELKQAAAEALTVADNRVIGENLRLLSQIAARL